MLVVALFDDAYRISAMVVLLWVDLYGIYEKCKGCGLNFKTLDGFLQTDRQRVTLTQSTAHHSSSQLQCSQVNSASRQGLGGSQSRGVRHLWSVRGLAMFEENPKKAELDTRPLIVECVSSDQRA